MTEVTIIVVLAEMLIVSFGLCLWFAMKCFYYKRRQKEAVQLIRSTWKRQQHLYGEVLRKRLGTLYSVDGEDLACMVDAVLQREQQLINQLIACLAKPEPEQLSDLMHFINRHGDIYCQLASNQPSARRAG